MEKDPFTWVDVEEHGTDKGLDILKRLEGLEQEVNSLRQEKSIKREDPPLIQRMDALEEEVSSLWQEKSIKQDDHSLA
ncbi:hypothetical protein N7463_003688 [Penicillium fimorum]|uniref:Uncharacterized protein n=1 Tax=Penicillium fimorum TaxID=1882269 RepID=A0A9W9Y1N4_9EURO|nr:hypothetical protein N7463_003688 [Penicillium fimorum]